MLDDITDPYAEIERLQGLLDRLTGKHKPLVRALTPKPSQMVRILEGAQGEWVSGRDLIEQMYPGNRLQGTHILANFKMQIQAQRPDLRIEGWWGRGYRLVPS